MIRIAVLDDYQNVALGYADWDSLGSDVRIDVFNEPILSEDDAATRLADYDVLCLMRERLPLPKSLIEKLPRLKLIVVTGGRVRVIDLDAAVAQGVTVCHTSAGESEHATPELAWALLLAAARHLPEEFARMRAGRWQETVGTTLGGKTLGLVGLGKLGSRMAPIGRAFGMRVVAWSPNLTPERAAAHGAEAVTKAALFETADAISIHVPGGAASRDLVGAAEISAMKPGAILVNTSRGPIVNEPALLAALGENRIRAGLDVYDIEPLPADHKLRAAPNAVLSPHLGFVTEGAYRAFYQDTVDAIAAWRTGKPIRVLAAPTG